MDVRSSAVTLDWCGFPLLSLLPCTVLLSFVAVFFADRVSGMCSWDLGRGMDSVYRRPGRVTNTGLGLCCTCMPSLAAVLETAPSSRGEDPEDFDGCSFISCRSLVDCFLRLLFALWHCHLGASFGPAHRDLGLLHPVHLELGAAGRSSPPYLPSARWVCPMGALAMFPTSSAVRSSFPRELLCFLHVVEDGPVFLVHPGCLLVGPAWMLFTTAPWSVARNGHFLRHSIQYHRAKRKLS